MNTTIKLLICCFLSITITRGTAQTHAFSRDIQTFKAEDNNQMPPKNSILFVGSSSFTKWTDVQQYFPSYPIINRGFGGSTLKDVIYYADDIILPYHPRQVVIYCGENDLVLPNIGADVVLDRFSTLFELIRKHYPDIKITYISMKPSPSRKNFRTAMEAGNAGIQYFLSQQKNTSYVDVYHKMLNDNGAPLPHIFLADSLHMNANGYKIWQKAIEPHLLK